MLLTKISTQEWTDFTTPTKRNIQSHTVTPSVIYSLHSYTSPSLYRADSRLATSQWEKSLQSSPCSFIIRTNIVTNKHTLCKRWWLDKSLVIFTPGENVITSLSREWWIYTYTILSAVCSDILSAISGTQAMWQSQCQWFPLRSMAPTCPQGTSAWSITMRPLFRRDRRCKLVTSSKAL